MIWVVNAVTAGRGRVAATCAGSAVVVIVTDDSARGLARARSGDSAPVTH